MHIIVYKKHNQKWKKGNKGSKRADYNNKKCGKKENGIKFIPLWKWLLTEK